MADINDVERLSKLKHESLSRGKKQRINKKLQVLSGETPEVKEPKTNKEEARHKVQTMLKKREKKMAPKVHKGLSEEDKKI